MVTPVIDFPGDSFTPSATTNASVTLAYFDLSTGQISQFLPATLSLVSGTTALLVRIHGQLSQKKPLISSVCFNFAQTNYSASSIAPRVRPCTSAGVPVGSALGAFHSILPHSGSRIVWRVELGELAMNPFRSDLYLLVESVVGTMTVTKSSVACSVESREMGPEASDDFRIASRALMGLSIAGFSAYADARTGRAWASLALGEFTLPGGSVPIVLTYRFPQGVLSGSAAPGSGLPRPWRLSIESAIAGQGQDLSLVDGFGRERPLVPGDGVDCMVDSTGGYAILIDDQLLLASGDRAFYNDDGSLDIASHRLGGDEWEFACSYDGQGRLLAYTQTDYVSNALSFSYSQNSIVLTLCGNALATLSLSNGRIASIVLPDGTEYAFAYATINEDGIQRVLSSVTCGGMALGFSVNADFRLYGMTLSDEDGVIEEARVRYKPSSAEITLRREGNDATAISRLYCFGVSGEATYSYRTDTSARSEESCSFQSDATSFSFPLAGSLYLAGEFDFTLSPTSGLSHDVSMGQTVPCGMLTFVATGRPEAATSNRCRLLVKLLDANQAVISSSTFSLLLGVPTDCALAVSYAEAASLSAVRFEQSFIGECDIENATYRYAPSPVFSFASLPGTPERVVDGTNLRVPGDEQATYFAGGISQSATVSPTIADLEASNAFWRLHYEHVLFHGKGSSAILSDSSVTISGASVEALSYLSEGVSYSRELWPQYGEAKITVRDRTFSVPTSSHGYSVTQTRTCFTPDGNGGANELSRPSMVSCYDRGDRLLSRSGSHYGETLTYDGNGRPTGGSLSYDYQHPWSLAYPSISYDSVTGMPSSETAQCGTDSFARAYSYGAGFRLLSETFPYESAPRTYSYSAGRLTGSSRGGIGQSVVYDEGRVESLHVGASTIRTMSYDSRGRIQSVQWGNATAKSFVYNALQDGGTEEILTIANGSIRRKYDKDGDLVEIACKGTNESTFSTEYSAVYQIDSAGAKRLQSVWNGETVNFGYGADGGLNSAYGCSIARSIQYDGADFRQVSVMSKNGYAAVCRKYDGTSLGASFLERRTKKGNWCSRASVNVSPGHPFASSETMQFWTGNVMDDDVLQFNRLTVSRDACLQAQIQGTDVRTPFLDKETFRASEGVPFLYTEWVIGYEYGTTSVNGKIRKITNGFLPTNKQVFEYGYDSALGILVTENSHWFPNRQYSYDSEGNLTSVKENGVTIRSASYDAYDRGNYFDDGSGILLPFYDNSGYPTSYRGKAVSYRAGRLMAYGSESLSYSGSRLTGESYNSVWRAITYECGEIASETVTVIVPEHSATIQYLNGPGGAPVGFLLDGALYEYVRDALGDVVALVKASDRSLAAVYAYSAYGETAVLLPDGAVDDDELSPGNLNPFRYRGQRQLLCGLYLMGARAYDPAFARFLSPDGEGYLDPCAQFGLNAYAYCYGDPMTYSDPSGHEAIALTFGTIVWILAMAGIFALAVTEPQTHLLTNFSKMVAEGIDDAFEALGDWVSTWDFSWWNDLWSTFGFASPASARYYSYPLLDIGPNIVHSKSWDPNARPGQKKQGRERKNKARARFSKKCKYRNGPKPLKHHTPGKNHRKHLWWLLFGIYRDWFGEDDDYEGLF